MQLLHEGGASQQSLLRQYITEFHRLKEENRAWLDVIDFWKLGELKPEEIMKLRHRWNTTWTSM